MATEVLQERSVESIVNKTLPDLPVELIGEIASHLDSASLHNLRNTTKWLAAAVEYRYTERHPTHTVCHHAKQLPGFLNQLTMPAIYTHINRLELRDGKFATAYPAFTTFSLPHLSELVLVGIELDGMSLLNTCVHHKATLRSLSIQNVYLEELCYWEAILFTMRTKLDVLQDKGLLYKSTFTGRLARVCLPLECRNDDLDTAMGLKISKTSRSGRHRKLIVDPNSSMFIHTGRDEIKQLIESYFRSVDRRTIDQVSDILCN
jgi:hypothetical protein